MSLKFFWIKIFSPVYLETTKKTDKKGSMKMGIGIIVNIVKDKRKKVTVLSWE